MINAYRLRCKGINIYPLMTFIRNFQYICKHKYYVMNECFKHGLYWQGITHDLSKFLPSEFKAYADKFFSGDYAYKYNEVEINFEIAWLHHLHKNPHHWEYWLQRDGSGKLMPLQIPDKYITEMICDWVGAGMAIKGKRDIKEWWENNKDEMVLHKYTKNYINTTIADMP